MPISFYDFSSLHHPAFLEQVHQRYRKILSENSFIEGKYNELFEKELATTLGAKYCRLVGNCTDALEIGLLVYGIGHGDKVGVPGITFHATAEAVLNVGAIPVIIDVDPLTGLMDPESLKRVDQEQSLKAIIPVHIYGLPAPIEKLEQYCNPRGIKILEDAAQAIGTLLPKFPVGGSQNISAFSFYPTKNLGAFGDAGAILTQNEEYAQKISSIRNHGRSQQGLQIFGRNSRCDHLQAAVLQLKLQDLPAQNNMRREIAARYIESLSSLSIQFPGKDFISTSSWHLFPILVRDQKEKVALWNHLKVKEIQSMLFYERALGDERPLEHLLGERKNARIFAEKVLCLPIHPFMQIEQVETVTKSISEFFRNEN